MGKRLSDIIDLDYFIRLDESRDSLEESQARTARDRQVFLDCKGRCRTDEDLLLAWLAARKRDVDKERPNSRQKDPLPGDFLSRLIAWMGYAMIGLGTGAGIALAYSFLAYHGSRPINVTAFMAVFVLIPLGMAFFAVWAGLKRAWHIAPGAGETYSGPGGSLVHTLLSSLLFRALPAVLSRTRSFGRGRWPDSTSASSLWA